MPTFFERRRLPPDPALWVWVAVALMALVPLTEHAVAARLMRIEHAATPAHATLPAPVAPVAPGAAAPQSPSAAAPRSPSAAGTATS